MADEKYSLRNAAINPGGPAFGNINLDAAVEASLSPVQVMGVFAAQQISTLGLTLEALGQKISLLTTAIESLRLKLSSQRSLSQSPGADAKNESVSEQADPDKAGGRIEPPDLLKPMIEIDSVMADLRQAARFNPSQSKEVLQSTLIMSTAPLVAAGGTSLVDLLKIESLAAKAGIVSNLPNASDRQLVLHNFASDAAVTATAFKVPAIEIAEMMVGWRNSMKLTGVESFDLADAINYLGKSPGDATAADIGGVLQRDGGAATAAGLTPAQAAALTAALLNTGTQKADAGAALSHIVTAMDKGDKVSATERAAWQQLNIAPAVVASELRQDGHAPGVVMSVLAALNNQPAEVRSSLATTLFADSGEVALRLSNSLFEVNQAFWQVLDNRQYATSELGNGGAVKQDALAQSKTQQGQWNLFNARNERLSMVASSELTPVADSALASLGSLTDRLTELAEAFPKTAAGIVVVAAAVKPLISALFKAVGDELVNRAAKRVLDGAAARLPRRLGSLISEDVGKTDRAENSVKSDKSEKTVRSDKSEKSEKTVKSDRSERPDKLDKPDVKAWNRRSEAVGEPGKNIGKQGIRSVTVRRLTGATASLRSVSRNAPGPLKFLSAAPDVVEGVLAGDKRMVAAGLGTAGGGWAGATAGASLGASLGSVVPIIGTAIGGVVGALVGGWIGSESGEWLGEKIVSTKDRLAAPDQVSKSISDSQTTHQQNNLTANIYINGQDQASASQLANLVVQQITGQFGLMTLPNSLAMRSDAALTDGGT
ncbi:phage tail tape measure protein [Pseudomonas laurylsulfatiphila]|uniref:phage tail tape measure protein n=1 Tax=Pseudomonas laurylsulfatiphila TaxID=2011015 RepID=UPI003D1E00B7